MNNMANIFLNQNPRDVETALLLEKAYQTDIGNAVAYTDGSRVFINTDDNLFKILPNFNYGMLKWLLWHEEFHKQLRHHNRFFKYLNDLGEDGMKEELKMSKSEVNIIMDILVHDSLAKLFPELVTTAQENLAQMRNRNSLKYTFKTHTLEEMLNEYRAFKDEEKEESDKKESDEDKEDEDKESKPAPSEPGISTDKDSKKEKKDSKSKSHGESDGDESKDKSERTKPEEDEPEVKADAPMPEPEHDKTDWSKLKEINDNEFISNDEGDHYVGIINKLKRKKIKLGKLTETLNGLVTSTRQRTYSMPCSIRIGNGVVLKGSTPGRAKLYLCFDASGSMSDVMDTFKDIISKTIPQAMLTPTVWFSGYNTKSSHTSRLNQIRDDTARNSDYFKGTFDDFMPIAASCGYDDDGDRVIELCWQAEQLGYSPIGITDGGGQISWSKDMIKQLKRTILVGDNESWLKQVKKINNKIQVLWI